MQLRCSGPVILLGSGPRIDWSAWDVWCKAKLGRTFRRHALGELCEAPSPAEWVVLGYTARRDNITTLEGQL